MSSALSRIILGGQSLEVLQRDATLALVDFGNVLEDFNRFLVLAAVYKEFGGLFEVEYNETQEEDKERDRAKSEHQVAPAHVVRSAAAWLAWRSDIAGLECEASVGIGDSEVRVARVSRNEAIGDSAADSHTDRLEDGQKREHKSLVLWDKLQADRCVDWDVSADTEPIEGSHNQERGIRATAA